MAVLCGMSTIQYSARSGPLSVHKLSTSCIRQCLVSRACDGVMSALSVVLLIFSFHFRSVFRPCRQAKPHSGVLSLPDIEHRTLPKIWVGFLYRPGNDFELILTVTRWLYCVEWTQYSIRLEALGCYLCDCLCGRPKITSDESKWW